MSTDPPTAALGWIVVSCHYVPCGLDSKGGLLPGPVPLTPPLLLLVVPPFARFRHACTLGGSRRWCAGLLPRAEGRGEKRSSQLQEEPEDISIFIKRVEDM